MQFNIFDNSTIILVYWQVAVRLAQFAPINKDFFILRRICFFNFCHFLISDRRLSKGVFSRLTRLTRLTRLIFHLRIMVNNYLINVLVIKNYKVGSLGCQCRYPKIFFKLCLQLLPQRKHDVTNKEYVDWYFCLRKDYKKNISESFSSQR